MKRTPVRRKTALKSRAATPDIVRIGMREFTIPPGTPKAKRRVFIAAAEAHVIATGDITAADAQRILATHGRRAERIARSIRRRPARTKYASRARDTDYMMFVKNRRCAAKMYAMPWRVDTSTPCRGPIEADHMGRRGVGRKAADDTCGPLCAGHHVERTSHSGVFGHATRAELRAWMDNVISQTRDLYARRAD